MPNILSNTLEDAVLESLSEAIWVRDSTGSLLRVNAAAAQLVGRAPYELIGRSFAAVCSLEPEVISRMASGQSTDLALIVGGEIRKFIARETPLRDRDGTFLGTVSVWRDSERTRSWCKSVADLELDPVSFEVLRDGQTSDPLTAKEFKLFSLLHEAPGMILERAELVRGLWGEVKVSANSLDVHLSRLRRKLARVQVVIRFVSPDQYRIFILQNLKATSSFGLGKNGSTGGTSDDEPAKDAERRVGCGPVREFAGGDSIGGPGDPGSL